METGSAIKDSQNPPPKNMAKKRDKIEDALWAFRLDLIEHLVGSDVVVMNAYFLNGVLIIRKHQRAFIFNNIFKRDQGIKIKGRGAQPPKTKK